MDFIIASTDFYDPNMASVMRRDMALKIGQVIDASVVELGDTVNIFYNVKVWDDGTYETYPCRDNDPFGGVWNFEETIRRGFRAVDGDKNSSSGRMSYRAGDYVLIGLIQGQTHQGLIITGISHQSRQPKCDLLEGIQYYSIFNGVENYINNDGEFTQTFRGQPTNIKELEDDPKGERIPDPIYDEEVGSSFYQWDKTGSFTLSDNAKQDPITMKINKPDGIFRLDVGQANLEIKKEPQEITINNKATTWTSSDTFSLTTKTTTVKSSDGINIETKKTTHMGDIESTGECKITGNTEITGNFKTSGKTDLAGGSHALVYDIIISQGPGNLGCPVISQIQLLKTVQTKAT